MTLKLQADVERPRLLARRRQVRVSFSGLDGAGKSSQIQALVAGLGEQGRHTEVLWLPFGFWPEALKDAVPTRLLRRMRPRKDGEGVPRQHPEVVGAPPVATSPSRTTMATLRAASAKRVRPALWMVTGTASAMSTGLSLRRRIAGSRADVLVLDRYRLDTLVKLCWVYPRLPQSWLAGIMRLVAPRPDLEVLFRVAPEVAYARKIDRPGEEWSLDQLTKHARLYDELVAGSPTVVTLDGERDPDEVARDVLSHVRPLLDGR